MTTRFSSSRQTLRRAARRLQHAAALSACGALFGMAPMVLRAQDAGSTQLVVIAGVSGEPRIAAQWHGMAMALATAATQRYGIPAARVTVLAEDSTRDAPRVQGRSSKVTIERVLGGLARSLTVADRLVVIVIAHGSSLGGPSRVNLPGPDMTPADFARVLAPATAPMIAFIHTGSASGDFATELAGPRRIVITATKSAREQNETLFPGPRSRRRPSSAEGPATAPRRATALFPCRYQPQPREGPFDSVLLQ